jgi:hypothetical protein
MLNNNTKPNYGINTCYQEEFCECIQCIFGHVKPWYEWDTLNLDLEGIETRFKEIWVKSRWRINLKKMDC